MVNIKFYRAKDAIELVNIYIPRTNTDLENNKLDNTF